MEQRQAETGEHFAAICEKYTILKIRAFHFVTFMIKKKSQHSRHLTLSEVNPFYRTTITKAMPTYLGKV
jgi:hypothetical protein